jgi:hypothetical protein
VAKTKTAKAASVKRTAAKPGAARAKVASAKPPTEAELVAARLATQQLVASTCATPAEVVARLGAVQAQDYLGSLWAIAQRCRAPATEATVEAAVAAREIVRGWPMRGTLHFTAAQDLGWMTRVLGARLARRTSRHRELGLDDAQFAACRAACERHLAGGVVMPRDEMYAMFARAGVPTEGQRGLHILGHLAMTGTLCFGPRAGKQFTFTLLDEWVPSPRSLDGDEALAEIALRYVAGHGPATVDDFAWWAGLNAGESKRAFAAAGTALVERAGYYTRAGAPEAGDASGPRVYLLPAWDEYTVGYRDRSAFFHANDAAELGNGIFSPIVVVDGRVDGTWKRTRGRTGVAIRCALMYPPARAIVRDLDAAAARYGAFLGTPATIAIA